MSKAVTAGFSTGHAVVRPKDQNVAFAVNNAYFRTTTRIQGDAYGEMTNVCV
jgi:hypothetical protein